MRLVRSRISPPYHSGHLRPRRYTSYLSLAVLLVAVGLILGVYTAYAADPPPQAGSVGLSGTMPEKPPTTGATITNISGSHYSTSPVTVTGTCPKGTLVEIFKNNIFAGSTPCEDNGTFSIKVDLLVGENSVKAQVYDVLNQPGPDSNTVTLYYDALPAQASGLIPLNFGGTQLLLNTNAVYRGTFPGQTLSMPVDIIGGTPPFAINVEWGDGDNKVVPRNNNLTFYIDHVYQKAGTYQITLQGSDAIGRVAFLTVAAIVNGQPQTALSTTSGSTPPVTRLLMLWPLYVSMVAVVISFWLGERREKHILMSASFSA